MSPARGAHSRFERVPSAPAVVVTAVGAGEGARGAAAALACAGADPNRATLLVDVGGRPPRPTLLASAAARALEDRLAAHLLRTRVAARGQVCHLAAAADGDGFAAVAAAATVARDAPVVIVVPPERLQELLDAPGGPRLSAALLRADVAADRALLALVARDLGRRGLAVAVLKQRLSWIDERRALFGVLGGESGAIPPRVRARVLGSPCYIEDNKFRPDRVEGRGEHGEREQRDRADAGSW